MKSRSAVIAMAVGILVVFASTNARAAVELVASGGAVDNPGTATIEILQGATTINLGLSSDAGPVDTGGGLAFSFGQPAGLALSDFAWDAIFSDPNNWFADPTLPMPAVVSFAPALPIPPAPDSIAVATMVANISAQIGAILDLSTELQVFDQSGNNLPTTGESENIRFEVVPEPATMGLLSVALVFAWRRRRSTAD